MSIPSDTNPQAIASEQVGFLLLRVSLDLNLGKKSNYFPCSPSTLDVALQYMV